MPVKPLIEVFNEFIKPAGWVLLFGLGGLGWFVALALSKEITFMRKKIGGVAYDWIKDQMNKEEE